MDFSKVDIKKIPDEMIRTFELYLTRSVFFKFAFSFDMLLTKPYARVFLPVPSGGETQTTDPKLHMYLNGNAD